jgi:hypothetical protein
MPAAGDNPDPPAGPDDKVAGQQQQQPAILAELGVSLESLKRLLTGDCGVASQQPVWMVVNLKGKIKGSYSASKMLEFSRRGTLSSAQLILGIDKDLPYVSRQVGGVLGSWGLGGGDTDLPYVSRQVGGGWGGGGEGGRVGVLTRRMTLEIEGDLNLGCLDGPALCVPTGGWVVRCGWVVRGWVGGCGGLTRLLTLLMALNLGCVDKDLPYVSQQVGGVLGSRV